MMKVFAECGNCAHADYFKEGATFDVLTPGCRAKFVNSKGELTTSPLNDDIRFYGNGYITFSTVSGSRYMLTT